jgi:hypothetical protein
MERKEVTPDVLKKIKTFERIDFEAFKALVVSGEIVQTCKLKVPRTIFYDDETCNFLYLNPYHGNFQKCGYWNDNQIS